MTTSLREWLRREVYGPRENRRLRGWLATAGMGVYLIGWLVAWLRPRVGDDPSIPLFIVFFLTISALTAAPLLFYVRLVRTFVASLVTGAAMVSMIAWAMVFLHTSSSSTAGLALLAPIIYNWGVLAAGWMLDQILLRYRPS